MRSSRRTDRRRTGGRISDGGGDDDDANNDDGVARLTPLTQRRPVAASVAAAAAAGAASASINSPVSVTRVFCRGQEQNKANNNSNSSKQTTPHHPTTSPHRRGGNRHEQEQRQQDQPLRAALSSNTTATPKQLCRFFFSPDGTDRCRYGAECAFSHELPDGCSDFAEARQLHILCPYYLTTGCRYAARCRYSHDGAGAIDDESSRKSAEDGGRRQQQKYEEERQEERVCGVCLEDVAGTGRKYGLLSCCDHVFCIKCVMAWRRDGTDDAQDRRCCPVCRRRSDFVVPSHVYASSSSNGGRRKQQIISQYKAKLSVIPCRRFVEGQLGSCPFGRDCFFAHLDETGADMKAQDRSKEELDQQRRTSRTVRQRHREMNQLMDDLFFEDLLYTMTMLRQSRGEFDEDDSNDENGIPPWLLGQYDFDSDSSFSD